MLLHKLLCRIGTEKGLVLQGNHTFGHIFEIARNLRIKLKLLGGNKLGRRIASQFVNNLLLNVVARKLGNEGFTRGNIGKTKAGGTALEKKACQVVVFILLEHTVFDNGTRGYYPDYLTTHQTFSFSRVLGLFTNSHLVALIDQSCYIRLTAMEGYAAHRRTLLLSAVTACKGKVQLLGGGFGVVEEHLVKIAQTEEHDAVSILFFYFHILTHHWRKLCHNRPSFLLKSFSGSHRRRHSYPSRMRARRFRGPHRFHT